MIGMFGLGVADIDSSDSELGNRQCIWRFSFKEVHGSTRAPWFTLNDDSDNYRAVHRP